MAQKIDFNTASSDDIERLLGRQLEALRLSRNINQTTLAGEAGVSRRTITRMENGEGISLDTLIRVMRALGVAERLATLLPDPAVRPVERVRLQGRERKHARQKSAEASATWTWSDSSGDE